MERLFQATCKQSWTYLMTKFLIFGTLTTLIFAEIYSGIFTSERNYKPQWRCFGKAAFTHPNPYFGDVNVSGEFS